MTDKEQIACAKAKITSLKAEIAGLTGKCEALEKDKENLERTLEEGIEELELVRKETAKKILQCLYEKCYEIQNLRECCAHITLLDILTFAKQYGVEVEE